MANSIDEKVDVLVQAVGARVARCRRHRGMTQASLAERLGIEPTTLSRLETGKRPFSLPLIVRIALCLEIPVGSLVDGEAQYDSRPGGAWPLLSSEHLALLDNVANALVGSVPKLESDTELPTSAWRGNEERILRKLREADEGDRRRLLRVIEAFLVN